MPRIAKKKKDPIKKRWTKLRAAVRNVWQYDPARKAVIEAVKNGKAFVCPLCAKSWPLELATVDHEPELGGFATWAEFFSWVQRCFEGPQRAICKPCHKAKPKPKKNKPQETK